METLTYREGDKEITLKFERLTMEHEDEWEDSLRRKIRQEAMADGSAMGLRGRELAEFVAPINLATSAGQCAFITPNGAHHAQTPWGIRKILSLASRHHHAAPFIPDDVIRKVWAANIKEANRIAAACLPFQTEDDEKKPNGQEGGQT